MNPSAPFYNSSAITLRNKIQEIFDGNGAIVQQNLSALKEIQVENAIRIFQFEIVDGIVFIK